MAYFILNKYDSNSLTKCSTTDNINFTYKADSSVTVIDYYGLMERGDNRYKNLDTTSMKTYNTINTLEYSDMIINNRVYEPNERSELKFNNSINIRNIQRGVITLDALGASSTQSIPINEVDMSKCYFTYEKAIGGNLNSYSYNYHLDKIIGWLSSYNTISFKNVSTNALSSSYPITISYQIIEFM